MHGILRLPMWFIASGSLTLACPPFHLPISIVLLSIWQVISKRSTSRPVEARLRRPLRNSRDGWNSFTRGGENIWSRSRTDERLHGSRVSLRTRRTLMAN
ncbi:hypothetical protein GGR50DRAFT_682988 [Xylaria sp. CBS 124048]|nr:hypothetical protein GGR50DRAFT_682988 [Xylaria sp. CBS 124048]